jgi:hypothetical protein
MHNEVLRSDTARRNYVLPCLCEWQTPDALFRIIPSVSEFFKGPDRGAEARKMRETEIEKKEKGERKKYKLNDRQK